MLADPVSEESQALVHRDLLPISSHDRRGGEVSGVTFISPIDEGTTLMI